MLASSFIPSKLTPDEVLDIFWDGSVPVDAKCIVERAKVPMSVHKGDDSSINCLYAFDIANHFSTSFTEEGKRKYVYKLLMPKIIILHLIHKEKMYNIADMAKIFNVPEWVMQFRLKELGIL